MTDVLAAPTVQPAEADPQREYVAGTAYWLGYRDAMRALPHAVDELEAELGDDLYTRMLHDPRVSGDVGLLVAAVLSDGVTITPAETPEGNDAAAVRAKEIAAFCERNLGRLSVALLDVLADMVEAGLAYGSKVAEQVYELIEEDGDDRGRLMLKALKPKPRKATAFVVDRYLNVIGLLAAKSGQARGLVGAVAVPNADEVLPREKFAVLTYAPKDSDPRGSTVLRPAYNFWWLKQQLLPEWLKLGLQFGTPSLVGTTEEKPKADPANPDTTPEDRMLAKLIAFQNGSALAVPYGAEVDVIESARAGGDNFFTGAMEACDKQITIGIFGVTRATQESQYGSRADSGTAKDLFDSIVHTARQAVARMVRRDVLEPLLRYNFGPGDLAYLPQVALGGVEEEDKAPAWTAAAALYKSGYLDASQLSGMDKELGLPPRDPAEVEVRRQRATAPAPVAPVPAAPGQQGDQQGQGQQGQGDDDDEQEDEDQP